MLINIFGILMPKTKFYLPLNFRKSRLFQSKRITVLSLFIIGFIYWNSIQIFQNIGKIENINIQTILFESNSNLTDKY